MLFFIHILKVDGKLIIDTNLYTIKFVNEDGTVLDEQSLAYGAMPAYKGATPTKAATAQYTYTFAGWSPAIVAVTGDATYTATYTATTRSYTVTFVDWDETVLDTQTVKYGSAAVAPEIPDRAGYTFTSIYLAASLTQSGKNTG